PENVPSCSPRAIWAPGRQPATRSRSSSVRHVRSIGAVTTNSFSSLSAIGRLPRAKNMRLRRAAQDLAVRPRRKCSPGDQRRLRGAGEFVFARKRENRQTPERREGGKAGPASARLREGEPDERRARQEHDVPP